MEECGVMDRGDGLSNGESREDRVEGEGTFSGDEFEEVTCIERVLDQLLLLPLVPERQHDAPSPADLLGDRLEVPLDPASFQTFTPVILVEGAIEEVEKSLLDVPVGTNLLLEDEATGASRKDEVEAAEEATDLRPTLTAAAMDIAADAAELELAIIVLLPSVLFFARLAAFPALRRHKKKKESRS
jgi:hypothetical protein